MFESDSIMRYSWYLLCNNSHGDGPACPDPTQMFHKIEYFHNSSVILAKVGFELTISWSHSSSFNHYTTESMVFVESLTCSYFINYWFCSISRIHLFGRKKLEGVARQQCSVKSILDVTFDTLEEMKGNVDSPIISRNTLKCIHKNHNKARDNKAYSSISDICILCSLKMMIYAMYQTIS